MPGPARACQTRDPLSALVSSCLPHRDPAAALSAPRSTSGGASTRSLLPSTRPPCYRTWTTPSSSRSASGTTGTSSTRPACLWPPPPSTAGRSLTVRPEAVCLAGIQTTEQGRVLNPVFPVERCWGLTQSLWPQETCALGTSSCATSPGSPLGGSLLLRPTDGAPETSSMDRYLWRSRTAQRLRGVEILEGVGFPGPFSQPPGFDVLRSPNRSSSCLFSACRELRHLVWAPGNIDHAVCVHGSS